MRAPVQRLLDLGESAAVEGMTLAADNAGEWWKGRAFDLAAEFVVDVAPGLDRPFEILEARLYAEGRGLPPPPDARAWGCVARRLKNGGLIVADSVGRSSDPIQHRGFTTLWRAA